MSHHHLSLDALCSLELLSYVQPLLAFALPPANISNDQRCLRLHTLHPFHALSTSKWNMDQQHRCEKLWSTIYCKLRSWDKCYISERAMSDSYLTQDCELPENWCMFYGFSNAKSRDITRITRVLQRCHGHIGSASASHVNLHLWSMETIHRNCIVSTGMILYGHYIGTQKVGMNSMKQIVVYEWYLSY